MIIRKIILTLRHLIPRHLSKGMSVFSGGNNVVLLGCGDVSQSVSPNSVYSLIS